MKKYIISIFALAAAVACSKMGSETVQQPNTPSEHIPGLEYEKLTVNTGAETKTSLNGLTCAWSDGDSFKVFADQTSYASANTFSMTSADSFEGEVPAGTEDFYAVYGNVGIASGSNGFTASVTIPNIQAAVAGSFDPAAHIAVAHGTRVAGSTEVVEVSFKTFNRLIKISVPENVTSVALSSATNIAGTVSLNSTAEGVLSMSGTASESSVTLTNGGSVIPAGTYYLCVAPVDMAGFQMTYSFTDGSTYTKSSANTLNMAANNQIRNLTLSIPDPTSADLEPEGFFTTYNYGTGDATDKNVTKANGMAFSAVDECGVKYNNGWGRLNNDNVYYSVDSEDFVSIANAPVLNDWKSYEIRVKASLGCQEVESANSITRHISGLPYTAVPPTEGNGWTKSAGDTKISFKSDYASIGDGGTATADPTIKSPSFYVPGNAFTTTTFVSGSTFTRRVGISYPCTLSFAQGNVKQSTKSNSTNGTTIPWNNLDTELSSSSNFFTLSVNGRTELSGYARIYQAGILYR